MPKIFSLYGEVLLQDKVSKVLSKIGRGADNLGKGLLKTTGNFAKFGAGIAVAAATLGGVATKAAADFQQELSNVGTLLDGDVKNRLAEFGENVKSLSISTNTNTSLLTDGLYQVVSAVGDTADSMSILETAAKGAKAGNATVTDSVNLLSAVMKGYGEVSQEAATKASDLAFQTVKLGQTTFPELAASMGKVIPLASTLKVTQEELFGATATLTGVTGGTAEVMTQLRAVLQGVLKPTADMEKAVQAMGYETAAAAIESEGLEGILSGLKEQVEGDEVAFANLFGSVEASTAALALTGAQAENFTKKTKEMTTAVGATDQAFERQNDNLNSTMSNIKNFAKVISINIGELILPKLNTLLKWFLEQMPKIERAILIGAKGILQAIKFIVDALDIWLESNNGTLTKIWDKTVEIFTLIKEAALTFWGFLVDVWEKNGEQITRIAVKYFDLLKKKFDLSIAIIKGIWNLFGDDIKKAWVVMWENLKTTLKAALDIIENSIDFFINIFEGNFAEAGQNIINIFTTLRDTLVTNITRWWEFFKPAFVSFKDSIIGSIHGLIFDFKRMGGFIVDGLVEGLTGGLSAATKAVETLAENTANTFKSFFGIRSPSWLMQVYGQFITEGLKIGIEKGEGRVTSQFSKTLGIWIDEINDKLNGSAGEEAGGNFVDGVEEGIEKKAPGVVKKITSWFKNMTDETKAKYQKGLAGVSSITSNLADEIGGSWGGVFDGVAEGANFAAAAVSGDWVSMTNSIISNTPKIATAVGEMLGLVTDGHKLSAEESANAWTNAYNDIFGATKQFTQDFGKVLINSVTGIIATFEKESRSGLSKWLFGSKKVINDFAESAVIKFNELSSSLSGTFVKISENSKTSFESVFETSKVAMTKLGGFLNNTYKDLNTQLNNELSEKNADFLNQAERNSVHTSGTYGRMVTSISSEIEKLSGSIKSSFDKVKSENKDVWNKVVQNVEGAVREIQPLLNQLRGIAVSDADKLGQATVSALEKKYEEEKELEEKRIKESLDLNEDQRKHQLDLLKDTFDKRMKSKNLEWEAIKLGQEKNQNELINLLETYEPRWEHAGRSLGESLVLGINAIAGSDVGAAVRKTLDQITEVRTASSNLDELQRQVQEAEERQFLPTVTPVTPGNTGNVSNRTVIINSPAPLDPVEIIRQDELASRKLALS